MQYGATLVRRAQQRLHQGHSVLRCAQGAQWLAAAAQACAILAECPGVLAGGCCSAWMYVSPGQEIVLAMMRFCALWA